MDNVLQELNRSTIWTLRRKPINQIDQGEKDGAWDEEEQVVALQFGLVEQRTWRGCCLCNPIMAGKGLLFD